MIIKKRKYRGLRQARIISIVLAMSLLIAMPAFSLAASLKEILINPDAFDGAKVTITGEVIGSPLHNDAGLWINMISDGAHIGVFTTDKNTAKLIEHWGDYKAQGDIIAVVGDFYKDCPVHQTSDIHLSELMIVKRGFYFDHKVYPTKEKAAQILLIICLTSALVYFIKERHKAKNKVKS